MSWNHDRSKKRLSEEWDRLTSTEIAVKRMTREMDFSNLARNDTRLVTGAHVYVRITNLSELLNDPLQRRDDYRRIYRTLHLTRVELRRIIQTVFDGDKIQVQGPTFHGLIYRPYNDPEQIAWTAVLAGLAARATLIDAFSNVFPLYPRLCAAVGIELGDTLVANIGMRGDRELISIGNAANRAAKIMRHNGIVIGTDAYNNLSPAQQANFNKHDETYRLDCHSIGDVEELLRDEGFTWSVQQSTNNIQHLKDSLPLDEITIETARTTIDLARLGPRHAKICESASIFVDLDGYTKLIHSLGENLEDLTMAVRYLHLLRYELRHVTENDTDGIVVQHQGDRLQALLALPHIDDDTAREQAAVLCVAFNSSVEEVLNKHHDLLGAQHVAIGCAFGKTLVGRLGTKGDRDSLCIGDATAEAERLQFAMAGNQLAITDDIHEAITDKELASRFTQNTTLDCLTADNLTFCNLEEHEAQQAYATASAAGFTSSGSIKIGAVTAVPLKVTRPFAL